MSERDPQLRRVIVEVKPEQLPELLSVLGDFAINNDVALIEIGESDTTSSETSIKLDEIKYNPKLTTLIANEKTNQKIAVITSENIKDYAFEQIGSTYLGTRLSTAIYRMGNYMLNDSQYRSPQWEPYLYENFGLRADKTLELVTKLKNGSIAVLPPNLGKASINLLYKLSDELIINKD